MTIVEFLEARLTEDEALARTMSEMIPATSTLAGAMVTRNMREIEAKRAVVALATPTDHGPIPGSVAWDLLIALAAVYADHPDFDPGWRV